MVAAAGGWAVGRSTAPAALPRGMAEVELRSRDIAFYAVRARRDPWSAADLAQLAGLVLQRARETGNYADFRRAEAVARRSLALRLDRNGKAYLTLASSLLGQHRFSEALDAARRLCELEPDVDSYRALLAEIQLELGDYASARATFTRVAGAWRNLAVAPRLARWAEIQGRTAEARYILEAARTEAARRADLPREQVAWFHLRVGDLELRHGRLADAERALRAGLAVEPGDFRLLGAMARLEALRHRWKKAIAYGERAGPAADIATLALVGDAHAALGDTARAEAYYEAVERAAREKPEPFNRQWTLFRLDHGQRVPETLALLREEIRVRRDVYGYDQLAWALSLQGDHAAARAAMAEALRMGTRDAMLLFHAGMIERALGSSDAASRYLRAAIDLNPFFHHTFPALARAVLDSLQAPPATGRSPQHPRTNLREPATGPAARRALAVVRKHRHLRHLDAPRRSG